MAYDIPARFHQVRSRHLREIERTKMCGRIIIITRRTNFAAVAMETKKGGFKKKLGFLS
jgi:hypothetical protein